MLYITCVVMTAMGFSKRTGAASLDSDSNAVEFKVLGFKYVQSRLLQSHSILIKKYQDIKLKVLLFPQTPQEKYTGIGKSNCSGHTQEYTVSLPICLSNPTRAYLYYAETIKELQTLDAVLYPGSHWVTYCQPDIFQIPYQQVTWARKADFSNPGPHHLRSWGISVLE